MNNIYKMMALSGMLLFAGCTADELVSTDHSALDGDGKLLLTIGMPSDSDDSRIAFDDPSRQLTWEKGDGLYLLGYDDTNVLKGTSNMVLQSGEGTADGKFSGYPVDGATQYVMYYKSKHLSFDGSDAYQMDYQGQTQNAAQSTSHLKDYLVLSSEKVASNKLSDVIPLVMRNSIVRFDITKIPEAITEVSHITWINEENASTDHSLRLNLTDGVGKGGALQAFFVFNPEEMKLGKGNKMYLSFEGNVLYSVEAVSANGKDYEPGQRYSLTVTTEDQPNTLHTWTPIIQDDNQIWVETDNQQQPQAVDGYKSPVRIPGTLLWKYEKETPGAITSIGEYLFSNNSQLRRVMIPSQVTEIGIYAFNNNGNLQSVVLPPTLKTIGQRAFNKSRIVDLVLPEGCETIGSEAFNDCTALRHVHFPSTLLTIENLAFSGNDALLSIDFPASLKKIGANAFSYSKLLNEITLRYNDNIELPVDRIFTGCYNIQTIRILSTSEKVLETVQNEIHSSASGRKTLYLHRGWNAADSKNKPDLQNYRWCDRYWNSIILVDDEGNPIQ